MEKIDEEAKYIKKQNIWRCQKCNSIIMAVKQIVSLHMKGTMAGFGETYRRTIPYCPQCEEKPLPYGFDHYGSKTDPETAELKLIKSLISDM